MGYEEFFPKRLAQLRQSRNTSAREMSLAIGQNSSYINRIENGKAFPSMQTFFYICEYLEITPAEFFDLQSDDPRILRSLQENLKKLTPTQLEHIASIVADLIR